MDKLFKIIRGIHLYAAILTSVFLLMYFISGGVMIMHTLFPRALKEIVSEQVTLNAKPEAENIAEICSRYTIYGEVTHKELPGKKKSYSYYRPAYRAEILVDQTAGTARVKISKGNGASVMNDFHRLKGYTGSWKHQIWSFLYDLSCVALIVFALTGVYLWWKKARRKSVGIIFLFVSTGITVFTVIYLITIC